MQKFSWLGAVSAITICVAGCSALPSQGPTASEVLQEANPSVAPDPRYLIADLNPQTVAIVDSYSHPSLYGRFGERAPAPTSVIGVGDTVQITVWEAASGGLFSSASINGITAGSHSASIPDQTVARDGTITVPYAGNIRVVGQNPHQVEAMIVERLAGKAIEPQAIVSITRNVSNTATVLGEVVNGARVPLSLHGDHILDVIAAAGGIKAPTHECFITLTRGGVTARVPMEALVTHPRENIYVRPGDVLTVVSEPQTFTAFGAAGRNALVAFEAVGISVNEAVAKAGGLLDGLADPQGVFLLRTEPAGIARQLDPRFPIPPGAGTVNVVYRINLKDTNTYFLAGRFAMRNKDVMYMAASPSTELYKALQLFGAVTGPAITGVAVAK